MTARQVVFYTALAVAVVLAIYVLYLLLDVLILIFIAILLATAIAPLVDRMRSRIGRGQAVLSIYLVLVLAVGLLTYYLVRVILEQTATLASNLPGLISSLTGYANAVDIPILRDLLVEGLSELSAAVSPQEATVPEGLTQGVVSATIGVFTLGFALATVLVMAYYWIVERSAILRLVLSLCPPEKRNVARVVWQQVEEKLGGWVRGQLILMAVIGVLSAIGYSVMGLKYAIFLAVIAGIAEVIPILGPWIGSAPAVIVALSQDFWLAVAVAVYAAIIQIVEGNILVPRIMGHVTGVSPLVVIIAILMGLTLMGIPGALLAVPVASTIQVLIQSLILDPESITMSSTPPAP